MMSSPGTLRRQKRMGPAPFASFEDLSDEQGSPEEKNIEASVVRLPGIREDLTPASTPAMSERAVSPALSHQGISIIGVATAVGPTSGTLPKTAVRPSATPRIDISRASSSSHHDSRDSSSEREIFDGHDKHSAKLGLGFREDGALELRSSTEELDFQDITERRRSKGRPQSPSVQEENNHSRKGSQCSDIVLLSISGRTSRLSSIGSQGSGQSRMSNVSHVSDVSGLSGISRASSPHKMLLETSFCGTKPSEGAKCEADRNGTKVEAEVMEKILLSRKHDPTQAIVAGGTNYVEPKSAKSSTKPSLSTKPAENLMVQKKCDVTITLDKPTIESNNTKRPSSRIVAESGVEYIYIPLKGPLPMDLETSRNSVTFAKHQKLREVRSLNYMSKSATTNRSTNVEPETRCKSASSTPPPSIRKQEDAKYIRIKLKPDRCYSDEAVAGVEEAAKPNLDLDLDKIQTSTEFLREIEGTRNIKVGKSVEAPINSAPSRIPGEITTESPSPSVSRRSSFASLFKGKGGMSPESPSVLSDKRKNTLAGVLKEAGENLRTRSRSRSKSRDRDSRKSSQSPAPSSTESIESKSKHKSVLSLFKSTKKEQRKKSESETSSQENVPVVEGIGKVEFKFNERKTYYENPLESASIRIPLHSPTYYENRTIHDWKTSSQDSQETVIEAPTTDAKVVVETVVTAEPKTVKQNSRQDSTTSENVVFSTKLSSNEVFTTKLPKKLSNQEEENVTINGIESINSQIEQLTSDLNEQEQSSEVNPQTDTVEENEHSGGQEVIANGSASRKSSQDSNGRTVCVTPQNVQETISDHGRSQQIRSSQISIDPTMGPYPEEDQTSSGSEREPPELARTRNDTHLKLETDVLEAERKAIVLQQDSFEDELPYIPTTLPLERSAAVPIVPIKQRSSYDVKTVSIERPKSTTPMNPNCLEEYCEVRGPSSLDERKHLDKIKISLPRNESFDKTKSRKGSNTNWTDFAERGISRSAHNETPPPLPPKAVQKAWINVDNIPEKRKAPKRIQTIPSLGHIEVPESVLQDSVIYNYVNPEECKCECHENTGRDKEKRTKEHQPSEDELPLLPDGNPEEEKTGPDLNHLQRQPDASACNKSLISDSSAGLSLNNDMKEAIIANNTSLHNPFTGDLGLTSNRSSVISQDDHYPPDSPNAFPKTS